MNTENNKIIAEFMGMKENNFTGAFKNIDNKFLFPSELVYPSNWNWLMEVVEKIENYNEHTSVFFAPQGCTIDVCIKDGFSYSNDCDTKIEAVYNACVEFIKWYNQQTK